MNDPATGSLRYTCNVIVKVALGASVAVCAVEGNEYKIVAQQPSSAATFTEQHTETENSVAANVKVDDTMRVVDDNNVVESAEETATVPAPVKLSFPNARRQLQKFFRPLGGELAFVEQVGRQKLAFSVIVNDKVYRRTIPLERDGENRRDALLEQVVVATETILDG